MIEIVSYDPQWFGLFKAESKLIKQTLGSNCVAVLHIGSTSVPGLAAKPIIDMIPVVKNIEAVDERNEVMAALGYAAKGEYGMPLRRLFQKGGEQRTFNAHVFEKGNLEIDRHLRFRDYLRAHDEAREAYSILKQELASKYPEDLEAYSLGKS